MSISLDKRVANITMVIRHLLAYDLGAICGEGYVKQLLAMLDAQDDE